MSNAPSHPAIKNDLEVVADQRKARGAFFTPPEISRFMAAWALRTPRDRVLEPSCGEAAFLVPAASRLRELGAPQEALVEQLHGQDIHAESLEEARQILSSYGHGASLEVGDFFTRHPERTYDAVIGNPPYVRYQNFAGVSRSASLEAALRQGVRLNRLASSWAAFTVHASAFLKPEGRLALVLPAELLAVKYAAQIRRFLLSRFRTVRLVLFENLVFPGVLEEVVLLLAEGSGGAQHFELYQARDAADLQNVDAGNWVEFRPRGDDKWTGALLTTDAFGLYDQAVASHDFEVMLDWGETYLGAVTGNNDFFTLTRAQAKKLRLPQNELVRISPPGSRHLRGLTFSEHGWEVLAKKGEQCYLFAPGNEPSRAAQRYISAGEEQGVHSAYKCQVRTPWWRVPLVARPDLLFAYMSHDRPRLVRNGAGVHLLNSLYGVRLHAVRQALGQELLAIASLNSLTLLGAEMVGRAYGGGMLKHEPTEVDRLPLPSLAVLNAVSERLRLIQPQIGGMLRRDDIGPVIHAVDRVVLQDHLGWSRSQLDAIRAARATLHGRRMTRARGPHGKD
ncbi:class I SAM-dependent DNA methyltransferase [Dokdonella sp.]|uniref:HsdM family class I SAM-dependent methyltransferase n=1 Tax=Dokdonella sp. TaxID=2291710 RepID=UPI00378530D4